MVPLIAASSAWAASNTVIAVFAVVAGIAAWRSKRGDFYKEVAAEKAAEIDKMRAEINTLSAHNDQLRRATDITPITEKLGEITQALERSTATMDQVLSKVADMNGGLRHTADALGETNENLKTSTRAIELLASQIIQDLSEKGR